MPGLNLEGVSKSFPTRGEPLVVLRNISLALQSGENLAILGPSGSGKSTLLHLMGTLDTPTTGTITLGDENPFTLDEPQLAHFRNRRIGFVFQNDAVFPWRSVRDNVAAGPMFRGQSKEQAHALADEWIRRVGLDKFGDHYPHQLSGGMRKRVALAQTLILDPDIILMDEPFSALDIQTRQLMENEVLDLWNAKKKAVLFITHDLDEAIAMSDRVIVLAAGPGTHPIGEFRIDLPRPRDVAEIRMHPRFVELHQQIWDVLRDEVLKGYQQQKRAA